MAETIYTKDGKCYVLLGSTTPVSIIRDYCGDEMADWVENHMAELKAEIDSLGDEVDSLESQLDEAEAEVAALNCKEDA